MASLREEARYVLEDCRDGIGWIAVWKTGRSWHCKRVYDLEWVEGDWRQHTESHWECKEADDIALLQAIYAQDPNATLVNGYYCNLGDPDEMTIKSLTDALRWQYEDGGNIESAIEQLTPSLETEETAEGGESNDGHQQAEGSHQPEGAENELFVRASRHDVSNTPAKDCKRERIYSLRNLHSEPAVRALRAGAVCNFFCRDG